MMYMQNQNKRSVRMQLYLDVCSCRLIYLEMLAFEFLNWLIIFVLLDIKCLRLTCI